MSSKEVRIYCRPEEECQELMRQAIDVMGISARACDRLLRVALTIADLAAAPKMEKDHLMEAINFRDSIFVDFSH